MCLGLFRARHVTLHCRDCRQDSREWLPIVGFTRHGWCLGGVDMGKAEVWWPLTGEISHSLIVTLRHEFDADERIS